MIFIITYLLFNTMKKNFSVDKSEFVRILRMHERATKNHYLLQEQVDTTEPKESKPTVFNLSNLTFEQGKYSLEYLNHTKKINEINKVLSQIGDFVNKNPNIPLRIQILAGESKLRNRDLEGKITNKGDYIDVGVLSKERGKTVREILINFFKNLYDSKKINYMPEILEAKEVIGTSDVYSNDQFIKFEVSAVDEDITTCFPSFKLNAVYNAKSSTDPNLKLCRGGHVCDDAIFDVYLDQTKIGQINLNNSDEACSANSESELCNRASTISVSSQQIESIRNNLSEQAKTSKTLTLWTKCVPRIAGKGCHTNVLEMYIINTETNKKIFPNETFLSPCVGPSTNREDAKSKESIYLMSLNFCGNPVNVQQSIGSDITKSLDDIVVKQQAELKRKEDEESQKIKDEQSAEEQRILQAFNKNVETFGYFATSNSVFNTNFAIDNIEEKDGNVVLTLSTNSTSKVGLLVDGVKKIYITKPNVNFKVIYPLLTFTWLGSKKNFEKTISPLIVNESYYCDLLTNIPSYLENTRWNGDRNVWLLKQKEFKGKSQYFMFRVQFQ